MKNPIIAAGIAAILAFGIVAFVPAAQHGLGLVPSYQATLANQTSLVSPAKTLASFTLGSITQSTSSVTTSTTLTKGLNWGLAAGDQCGVQLTSATATTGFSGDGYITSIGTSVATVTVTFFNGGTSTLTVPTGTLKVNCNHY